VFNLGHGDDDAVSQQSFYNKVTFGDIVRGVLGNGGGDQPAGGTNSKDLLKKLFR